MIVRVLGSAAGGGVPQWNCTCPNCSAARAGTAPRRTQSTVAMGIDGRRWLLLNCSPDIAMQIEGFPPLQPHDTRETPIDGMLLTDANVDHLGGLAVLRQSGSHRFVVRSSAIVRDIAISQPAFAPFASTPHRWIEVPFGADCVATDADDLVGHGLRVRTIPVPGTTPGYAGRASALGAVVAYEITAMSGGETLLFAPVFADIDESLYEAIARCDVALVDGSFYTDNELIVQGLTNKRAHDLGHLPIGGAHGSLSQLRGTETRIIFTHLNNSNPVLDPHSQPATDIRSAGFEVAYDGMHIVLP